MPPSLLYCELRVARCPDISDTGVQVFAKSLPSPLKHLILDFRFCANLTDSTAKAIADHLPSLMKHLEIDFVGCGETSIEAERILQKVVEARHGLKLTYWGKDDLPINC